MVSLEGCQRSPCSANAEAKSRLQKCLQLRIDTVRSLTCSPAIVSVFNLQDKGWVPLHPPLPGSGYALSVYCSASWGWPRFPGRVLECERWGGLWRFPSRSALQLRIQEIELFKTNTCINHALKKKKDMHCYRKTKMDLNQRKNLGDGVNQDRRLPYSPAWAQFSGG